MTDVALGETAYGCHLIRAQRLAAVVQDMMAYPTDPTSLSNVLWAVKDGA